MKTYYVVRAIPVRDGQGSIHGWVRADVLAEGTKPTDKVYLSDGSACDQAVAAERIGLNPALVYATRDEAVRDGLRRLREADAASR